MAATTAPLDLQKMDQDLDDYLDKLAATTTPRRDTTDGLDIDQFLAQLNQIPAFMDSATPAPESGHLPPLIEALQSLKYDEDNPDVCAENYKVDGNQNFKMNKFKLAIECYDKGLKLNISKMDLKANLFSNRAAANYRLGNYRKCIVDCGEALKLDSKYLKAFLKGAQALFALGKFSEAKTWTDRGLRLQDDNPELLSLGTKIIQAEKKKLLSDRKILKIQENLQRIFSAISQRKITLSPPYTANTELVYSEFMARTPSGASVHLSNDGDKLIWPLRILFPEVNQQEILDQVEEDATWADILQLVIEQNPPPWDDGNCYRRVGDCRVYFSAGKSIFQVLIDSTLGSLLARREYVVENCMPTVIVLSRKSEFMAGFLAKVDLVGKA